MCSRENETWNIVTYMCSSKSGWGWWNIHYGDEPISRRGKIIALARYMAVGYFLDGFDKERNLAWCSWRGRGWWKNHYGDGPISRRGKIANLARDMAEEDFFWKPMVSMKRGTWLAALGRTRRNPNVGREDM